MPSGAEHRERAYVAASRRTDRPPEARLASAIKASQAHYERTGRRFKITMDVVLGDEMYREEEEPRPRLSSSSYMGADRPSLGRKRSPNDGQEPFEVRERRVNQMFDLAFPWHRQHCLQQNQRREREEREDREDYERDTRASRAASMASGTSGTSAPSTTVSGAKPLTPTFSPTPHTPGTTAFDTIIPSLVSTDAALALNSGLASAQDYPAGFVASDDQVYVPGPAAAAPRKTGTESLLVSTATTKAPNGPCLWTPPDEKPVSADTFGFSSDQAFFPQTASGPDGSFSDRMVAVDENGNYYISLDAGNGDYDTAGSYNTSTTCSNMIMRSFNPSMLSMGGADLGDAGLFASVDPADPADTTLGEPTAMLYSYASTSASPTSASDRDCMYATTMTAFPPFSADR